MQIPSWPQSGEREAELLREVLESTQWGGFHPFISEFEQSFAAYQHCPFGISAFNGTVTLELALSVLGIGLGDEVIVPAISFISTATAIARAGATPVFVDIEEASFNIDPERVREAMTPQTRAVMAVHFGGVMANMAAVQEICSSRAVVLIEDAAHAHGSEWNGRRAGSFGIAGSFSFQNGKVLSSGEGGILVTSDTAFADRARSIANCGRIEGKSFYHHERLGTNFRLTALQAAVLIAQFERLNEQIETRTANARLLQHLVSDVAGLVWQQIPAEVSRNSYYLLTGRIRQDTKVNRDEFHQRLVASGVPCTPFYPHTLYDNPVFQDGNCRVMPCPVSEARVKDAFWLPHRALLADEQTIHEIADALRHTLSPAESLKLSRKR
jgi:dTDP-4-amino-4,6-dideoxygalactose transaminase